MNKSLENQSILPAYISDNTRLNTAICFAVEKHNGQLRKTSTLPYILHPLETMNILAAMRADIPLMIAGILHDTLEDTDATYHDLVSTFGEDVARLVQEHTDNPNHNWQERKNAEILTCQKGTYRVKQLILADKVSNLRTMVRDKHILGNALWDCFSQPKEKQAWFYGEMIKGLSELKDFEETAPFYHEMLALYERLFEA